MVMKKTNNPAFTIKAYRKLHDCETMPTAPPFGFTNEYLMIDPDTQNRWMEKLPVYAGSGWVHLAMVKEYAHKKMAEFGSKVIQFEVTWPAGDKNWISVDRGDFHKVW